MPTMKAVRLHAVGRPPTVDEVPRPVPGPGEVLVRVRACGVGLTVVHTQEGRTPPAFPQPSPLTMGHEATGEVAALGAGVTDLEAGQPVAVYFYLICGQCRNCLAGRESICLRHRGYVGRQIHGAYAEYIVLPRLNVIPMAPGTDWEAAAIATDAVATPIHVMRDRARVHPGDAVVVVGAGGGVGVHCVQVAKRFGAFVIAVDRGADKLRVAKEVGADAALDAAAGPWDEEARRLTEGRGVDAVADFVASADTLNQALNALALSGRIVVLGVDPKAILQVAPGRILRGEVGIIGSRYASRAEVFEAVEMVRRGDVRAIIGARGRLEDVPRLHAEINQHRVIGRAVIVP
jgi:propanol-preferring alcohol dehydrogenase